jgi:ectoine hydroxylase-related dioxygenase (phytanoyl-CoA dioxygenase family)
MSEQTRAYGIVEQASAATLVAQCAERIRLVGYAVLPGGYDDERLDGLRHALDRTMAEQVAEFGGADRMHAIGDTLTARCPLVHDAAFVTLAANDHVLALARELLGPYVVLMQQNGVLNPPRQGHTQLAYHRDLPYQHFVSSRPLAVSALFCLDPFRVDNGATTVIPASHKVEAFPSPEVAAALDTPVTAEAGSFIVFDSMLFHRAGTNRSEQMRRAVNHVYTTPIIGQQISLPQALGGRYADDPLLGPLFGYGSTPAPSALEWRRRRLDRVGARVRNG